MDSGGLTFRDSIDRNKHKILEYLEQGEKHTTDIVTNYNGERDKYAVRKALNELRKEGKITTDDHVHFWRGKLWKLIQQDTERGK